MFMVITGIHLFDQNAGKAWAIRHFAGYCDFFIFGESYTISDLMGAKQNHE